MGHTYFKNKTVAKTLTAVLASLALLNTACLEKEIDEITNNTVGGVVQGLNGTVVLQNSNGDELEITSDGPFAFQSPMTLAERYEVTIVEQPETQECAVRNHTGMIGASSGAIVEVTCSTIFHFVGVTVVGLQGNLAILNNGTDVTHISADGSYAFPTFLVHGASYNVTINAQPSGQTCVVNDGSGIANDDVTDIIISCGP